MEICDTPKSCDPFDIRFCSSRWRVSGHLDARRFGPVFSSAAAKPTPPMVTTSGSRPPVSASRRSTSRFARFRRVGRAGRERDEPGGRRRWHTGRDGWRTGGRDCCWRAYLGRVANPNRGAASDLRVGTVQRRSFSTGHLPTSDGRAAGRVSTARRTRPAGIPSTRRARALSRTATGPTARIHPACNVTAPHPPRCARRPLPAPLRCAGRGGFRSGRWRIELTIPGVLPPAPR